MSQNRSLVSVVVPCYNEEKVLSQTHQRLTQVMSGLDADYEIVYVNDGSRDGTEGILRQLQAADSHVRAVVFARNFGHQIAVTAGMDYAAGDGVVIIDADLQDPPEVIPQMIAKWREGYEVVYGVRARREGETAFKLWTAKWFYRLINHVSDTAIPLDTGDFRLVDRRAVEVLRTMPERDRFVRGMVAWVGFRQVGLPYDRAARAAGETKYPLKKMVRFAIDGILSFSVKPLRWATFAGGVGLVFSILAIINALGNRMLGRPWGSDTSLIVIAILLLGSLQLLTIGILGEYVGRIYMESKRRPLYIVRESLGAAKPTPKQPAP